MRQLKQFGMGALFSVLALPVLAEPFIKTDDLWLRADIETLANLGVIKSPVTTYPLTWGPILKDLSEAKLNKVPEEYHATYFRVLREGRNETGRNNFYSEIRVSASQENELFRSFGDKARNKREVATRTTGMTNNFAWNLEVTLAPDSIDGDDKRFDGSYIAGIGGNWILSLGQIEKWWGPGLQHSIILSNNAKPVPAINFQRNYSEPFETPLLSWMGPWTFSSFIGLLDDERTIDNAKLLGLSVSFKPLDTLEVGLRRTAQWGGQGRPENFDSFLDLLVGLDNCDEGGLSCDDPASEPGNQLAGIDVTWRPRWAIPSAFYFQTVGEDEAGFMPSKKAWMYGANFQVIAFDNPLMVNLEYIDTSVDGDGNDPNVPFDGYNVLYEHGIYKNGYRYHGRSIGSSLDNDSTAFSAILFYTFEDWGSVSYRISSFDVNSDSTDKAEPGGSTISPLNLKFREHLLNWTYETGGYGKIDLSILARSKDLNSHFGFFDKTAFNINWMFKF
ncbi:MAG: capsule assembly Wzi family protein [Oceanospirillaceae bacterium]|nr:capsule assembly Wzi family protein [Oceanospirillaceae bacterium]